VHSGIRNAIDGANARLRKEVLSSKALGVSLESSFVRALLTLVEGVERAAAEAAWLDLRERTVQARRSLSAHLDAALVDRFGVDRAALCAVRRAHAVRAARDAAGAACMLFGVLTLVEVRALTGQEELAPDAAPASVPESRLAAGVASATDALEELLTEAGSLVGKQLLLTPLNPHAGTHVIPDDLRTIAVALEAGQQSFDAYAYYALRYGDRGRAFTRTDSAWIAAIARQGREVTRQLTWLAGVLASRGMPSLLLEEHLEVLAAALVAAFPGRTADYTSLRSAAQSLRTRRTSALFGATEFRNQIAAALAAAPAGKGAPRISAEEVATLVVAALADRKAGMKGAMESLREWFLAEGRFGPEWRAVIARVTDAE
jgi:hypothetical protein